MKDSSTVRSRHEDARGRRVAQSCGRARQRAAPHIALSKRAAPVRGGSVHRTVLALTRPVGGDLSRTCRKRRRSVLVPGPLRLLARRYLEYCPRLCHRRERSVRQPLVQQAAAPRLCCSWCWRAQTLRSPACAPDVRTRCVRAGAGCNPPRGTAHGLARDMGLPGRIRDISFWWSGAPRPQGRSLRAAAVVVRLWAARRPGSPSPEPCACGTRPAPPVSCTWGACARRLSITSTRAAPAASSCCASRTQTRCACQAAPPHPRHPGCQCSVCRRRDPCTLTALNLAPSPTPGKARKARKARRARKARQQSMFVAYDVGRCWWLLPWRRCARCSASRRAVTLPVAHQLLRWML